MTKSGTETAVHGNLAWFPVPGVGRELGTLQEALHRLWEIRSMWGRTWQSLWDPSPGHVFLLQAMEQISSTRSARPPSVPLLRRSRRIKWLSEPPAKRGICWGTWDQGKHRSRDTSAKKGFGLQWGLSLVLGAEGDLPLGGGVLLQNSFADVLRNCDGRALPITSAPPSWPGLGPGLWRGVSPIPWPRPVLTCDDVVAQLHQRC